MFRSTLILTRVVFSPLPVSKAVSQYQDSMSAVRDLVAMQPLLFPSSLFNKDENSRLSAAPLPPPERETSAAGSQAHL